MDLNRLYFQHQISLIQVSSAEDLATRIGHQAEADGFARTIERFQRGKGAGAAAAWGSHGLNKRLSSAHPLTSPAS